MLPASHVSEACLPFAVFQINRKKPKDKPLLRRKSELPHDITMIKALDGHKRPDEYLRTNSETN